MAHFAARSGGVRGADLRAAARVRVRRSTRLLLARHSAAPAVSSRQRAQVGQFEPGAYLPSGYNTS